MAPSWMIDELAHAGPEHSDPGFVAGYDRKQGPFPDDEAAADIDVLRALGLDEQSTVVDMGAGTGRFVVSAAPVFGQVVAVDVSATMLDVLRARLASSGLTNVSCVQSGFLSYEHDGPAADAVYTRNALHHLPDFWKALALARLAGVLRPGGVLRLRDLVYDFQPTEAPAVFDAWFGRAVSDPAAGYTAEDYAEHIRTEHSTFSWLLAPMLEAAGFEIVSAELRTVFGAYTCVKR